MWWWLLRLSYQPRSQGSLSCVEKEPWRVAALVTAGYVEMSVNKLRGGDRSPIKFCRLDDEILSGVGRKFLLQNDA